MQPRRGRKIFFLAVVLSWSLAAGAVEKGQSLAAALEELRGEGLQLIFSSALIDAGLRVNVEPGSGSAEEIARRILAPHGLTLEAIRPGLFSVVKQAARATPPAAVASGASRADSARETPSPEVPDEVDIYASRYQIDQQESAAALAELSREDIEALPGLNEDALRVTHYLPGTAANAVSARTHVRGGRDDELAVFFDGVPLFEPFHYKDVQSLLGILDPDSISSIDFFSGVFPVHYGNRLSGVLDIKPRTGSGKDYNAIGASFLYSHALSQGRLESYPLEWLASVRRGNVDLFTDLVGRHETEPNFLDALGRLQVDVGARSTLAVGYLLLDDTLEADLDQGVERGHIEYRDATGWASWRFHPNDASEMRAVLSRTERHTNRAGSVSQPANSLGTVDDRRRFDTNTARLEASTRLGDLLSVSGGVEAYRFDAVYGYTSRVQFDPVMAAVFGRATQLGREIDLAVDGESYAAYASTLVSLSRWAKLDLALRWDAQRFGAAFSDSELSPRLSLEYDFSPATIVRASWGRLAQTQRPDELQVQDGDMAFHPAQRATETVISLERHVTPATLLRIEAYDKSVSDPSPLYENLLDPFALLPELEVDRVRVQPDRSRMHGVELNVRWQLSRIWSGAASYSWSQATDEFGSVEVPRTWDQKHALSTNVTWTSRPWQMATNLTWHSGWRRNEVLATPQGPELTSRNAEAWPAYLSLDMRVSWARPIGWGALEMFGEVDNLTNHANFCCSNYPLSAAGVGPAATPENTTWLPRVFLVGFTWQLP